MNNRALIRRTGNSRNIRSNYSNSISDPGFRKQSLFSASAERGGRFHDE
ncbi:hypothetical protein [Paenibacillus sp. NPDC058071]